MRKVVIIGCGKVVEGKEGWAIGHAHAQGWLDSSVDVELYAVDVNRGNLRAFGERFQVPPSRLFTSTEEFYQNVTPDRVSICTWPALHAPMAIEAAEKGVAGIVLEKPVALNLEEMNEIKSACDQHKTQLVVAHQRCYAPACRTVKALLAEGALGKNLFVEARVHAHWDILSWTVHWFNLTEFLLGQKPISVLAGMELKGGRRYQHAVEEQSSIFVDYEKGAQAIFITGPDSPVLQCGLRICGEKGMINFAGEGDHYEIWDERGYRKVTVEVGENENAFAHLFEDLEQAIVNERPPQIMKKDFAFRATELAYAAQESVRLRSMVTLPLKTKFAPLEVLEHRQPTGVIPEGKVLLIADEHFGSGGLEAIVQAMQDIYKIDVQVLEPHVDFSHDLQEAGLVLVYHTQEELHPNVAVALEDYVEQGLPLLVLHAGLGAWRNWSAYQTWVGRVWEWGGDNPSWHPHREIEMEVLPQDHLSHFAIPWEKAFLPKDECFVNLKQTSACLDLIETTIPEGCFPVAWVSAQHRNVGAWMPGHDASTWTVEGQRDGLKAMVALLTRQSVVEGRSS